MLAAVTAAPPPPADIQPNGYLWGADAAMSDKVDSRVVEDLYMHGSVGAESAILRRRHLLAPYISPNDRVIEGGVQAAANGAMGALSRGRGYYNTYGNRRLMDIYMHNPRGSNDRITGSSGTMGADQATTTETP